MRYISALTTLCMSFVVLSACAPQMGFKAINPTNTGGFNGDLITGGINENGEAYTAFGSSQETVQAKAEVPSTEANSKFAENIQTVKVQISNNIFQLKLQWKGLSSPLQFEQSVNPNSVGNRFEGLLDKSEQMKDLKLDVSCDSSGCSTVHALLADSSGHKASLIIRREERTLKLKIPDSQKKNANQLPPELKQKIQEQEKGKAVIVTSTEVYPGRSTFEISEMQETLNGVVETGHIKGDLLDTSEGATSVETAGEFANLGKAELVGNSNDGELVFRFSQELDTAQTPIAQKPTATTPPATSSSTERVLQTEKWTNLRETPIRKIQPAPTVSAVTGPAPKKVVSYLVLEPREKPVESASPQAAPNADTKSVDVTGGKANHPLVKQILADRTRPEVQDYIAKHISIITTTARNGQKTEKFADFYKNTRVYIACHAGDAKGCGVDSHGTPKLQSVTKMTQVLQKESLPSAITMVSLIESFYEPGVESGAGALGWWQFMPDTARGLGLRIDHRTRVDERKDLMKSTTAAAKYLKDLLVAWKGDLKMALASYNRGEGAMRRSCLRRIQTDLCRSGQGKGVKFEEMKDMLEISNNDFWKFYRQNFIPSETQNYVLKFLAGNLVAHSPRDYGMEYDAIDLN